jgi:prephenate dehydrogenase
MTMSAKSSGISSDFRAERSSIMSDTERRLTFRSAGVIGLGLIGGSIARDLAALGVRMLGYDRDPATIDMARAEGVVDEPLDASLEGLHDVEVVIVAVPVSLLRDVLAAAPPLPRARLITDVGSTKRSAIVTAEALGEGISQRFVGAHPIAGDHRSGWISSRRGLFADAKVYLCRAQHTCDEAATLAQELWRALGACPELIAADAHDELLAYASHAPQAVSTALALALAEAGVSRAKLGPGGRDTTRLAGGSVEMWTAIARDNADALLPAITAVETQLQRLREAIALGDEAAVRALFSVARAWSTG